MIDAWVLSTSQWIWICVNKVLVDDSKPDLYTYQLIVNTLLHTYLLICYICSQWIHLHTHAAREKRRQMNECVQHGNTDVPIARKKERTKNREKKKKQHSRIFLPIIIIITLLIIINLRSYSALGIAYSYILRQQQQQQLHRQTIHA